MMGVMDDQGFQPVQQPASPDEAEVDNGRPIELNNEEAENGEEATDGNLTHKIVSKGLSNLGRSADGNQLVYLDLSLPGYNFVDISVLQNYSYVQVLEMPYNKVSDLSVISSMPYLVELDVSNNQIQSLKDIKPPHNLKELNLSFNQLVSMDDLASFHTLTKLVLDNNNIGAITGLNEHKALTYLSLAHNRIEKIENLSSCSLMNFLNLRGNQLKAMENLSDLLFLQHLDVSGNFISSLQGLTSNRMLEVLDIENNHVEALSEIQHIQDLSILRQLNLLRNPIQGMPDYRLSILYRIPQLSELDRHKAESEQKVASVNLFNPSMEVVAADDHRKCIIYSCLRSARLYDSTLSTVETPYPMLVLVGPPGAGKHELANKLTEDFPNYFGYGILHTTRSPYPGEIHKKDFFFVPAEAFGTKQKQGDFLVTYQSSGLSYGVSQKSVDTVAKQGLACILPMELEGVLSLKLSHYEPRYILVVPLDSKKHEERLTSVGYFSNSQIKHSLERAEIYKQTNQDKPGFFDMVVDTSNLMTAYKQLKVLVAGYLGIGDLNQDGNGRASSLSQQSSSSSSVCESQTESSGSVDRLRAASGMASSNGGIPLWSKAQSDAGSQSAASVTIKKQAATGRTSVEQASYERRKSAAQMAAAGILPKPLDELVNRPPRTAPANPLKDLEGEVGRPRTGPATFAVCSPDSSLASARSGSSLTNLSDTRGVSVSPSSSQGKDGNEEDVDIFGLEEGANDFEDRKPPSQLSF
ncbi:uncharacterized protein [Amphiura filiformis]|uniref:uncharacterized protein n=1 Tax=Amphiura filiformis TaxID=82378 RepID=UPI003B226EDC